MGISCPILVGPSSTQYKDMSNCALDPAVKDVTKRTRHIHIGDALGSFLECVRGL